MMTDLDGNYCHPEASHRLDFGRASFREAISNWWLLAIVPLALGILPVLLMGFFMANNLAGAMLGPPAIWSRPWRIPPRADLVGNYVDYKRHLDDKNSSTTANFTLNADGSMSVSNLPAGFGTLTCTLSGTGSWKGPDDMALDSQLPPTSSPVLSIRLLRSVRARWPFKSVSLVLDRWRP